MKAVVLPAYGAPSVLALRDVAEPPAPGPGEIAVRVAAASVNPVDWKLRSGALWHRMPLDLPAVLGRDVSGTVTATGPDVTAPGVGARVIGLVGAAYAERVVAPAAWFAEIPDGLDLVEAAALPLVVLTGAQLVEEAAEVRAGELVLVTGATGSVGRSAVFCAKARGATVWAGVRRAHAALAATLGASGVVSLDDVQALAKLPPMDVIVDTVGGEATQRALASLKPGARIASVVGEPARAKERGFVVRAFLAHPDGRRLADLARAVAARELVIPIARRFPLAEAAKAHEWVERGAGGKVLLTMPGNDARGV
jgi:NADPH:quinone reductase-like Zn-dependent oxidoreductase